LGQGWPLDTAGGRHKTQPLTNEKNPALHPALPHKTPPPQPRHGVHSLLQYSEGEAGDEGRAVVGRGSWGRQNKNTWRPPRVKKRAEEKEKRPLCPTTTCACHHAHPPLCTGATRHGNAHYYSFRQAWHMHGRSWQDQEERGASEEVPPPHHFRQGVSESADSYRFHPHVRRYSALPSLCLTTPIPNYVGDDIPSIPIQQDSDLTHATPGPASGWPVIQYQPSLESRWRTSGSAGPGPLAGRQPT
jgi:hypothetical protein